MHRTGSEFDYLQFWDAFPTLHPAYFRRILSATLSRILPLHWKLYAEQLRVLDLFRIFHGWVPSLQAPKGKVIKLF